MRAPEIVGICTTVVATLAVAISLFTRVRVLNQRVALGDCKCRRYPRFP